MLHSLCSVRTQDKIGCYFVKAAKLLVTSTESRHSIGNTSKAGLPGSKPFLIPFLFIGFILPFYFDVLGMQINGYRLVLLIFFIPAVVRWLDRSIRVQTPDILIVCFAIWNGLAIIANHGFARWEYVGIALVETLSPYFIARWMIRDAAAFRSFAVWLFAVVAIMLPFSVYQSVTNTSLLLNFFSNFGQVYKTVLDQPRLGFYRAQGSMPHPILFGLFCSTAFAISWYVLGYGKSLSYKLSRVGIVVFATVTSLSSGAWLAIAVQVGLMGWKTVFSAIKKKWNLLLYIFVGLYAFIEVFSNRPPAQLFAAYLTLKKSTAWNRIHIFTYASDDILRNPVFGIGLKDWSRPRWMVPSVDNYWLLVTMRHGFPSLIFLLLIVFFVFRSIGRANLNGRLASYRYGYLFALSGFCVAAITVHVWDATFCLFMFMLGAGLWMVDAEDEVVEKNASSASHERRTIRYTRFG